MVPLSELILLPTAGCKGMFPYWKSSPHFTSAWSKSRGNAFSAPRLHVSENPWNPGPTLTTFTGPWKAESHGTACLCLFSPQDKRRTRTSIAGLSSSGCRARCQFETSIERKQFSEPCLPPSHCHESLPQQKWAHAPPNTAWDASDSPPWSPVFWASEVYKLINCPENIYILLSISCFSPKGCSWVNQL